MGEITIPDESWREDHDSERKRQRELDDAREVQEALFRGREAGRSLIAAGLNPYHVRSPQSDAWERGRSDVIAQAHSRRAA